MQQMCVFVVFVVYACSVPGKLRQWRRIALASALKQLDLDSTGAAQQKTKTKTHTHTYNKGVVMQTSGCGYRRGGPLERAAATGMFDKKPCSTAPSSTERHSEVLHGLLQLVSAIPIALLSIAIWILDLLNNALHDGLKQKQIQYIYILTT